MAMGAEWRRGQGEGGNTRILVDEGVSARGLVGRRAIRWVLRCVHWSPNADRYLPRTYPFYRLQSPQSQQEETLEPVFRAFTVGYVPWK